MFCQFDFYKEMSDIFSVNNFTLSQIWVWTIFAQSFSFWEIKHQWYIQLITYQNELWGWVPRIWHQSYKVTATYVSIYVCIYWCLFFFLLSIFIFLPSITYYLSISNYHISIICLTLSSSVSTYPFTKMSISRCRFLALGEKYFKSLLHEKII